MSGRSRVKSLVGAVVLAILVGGAGSAQAADDWTDGFMVRFRGIAVVPDESSDVTAIGGHASIDNAVMPELDISYFFTENFALELILATSKHTAKVKDSALGEVEVGDFWILPPTLLAQYHLPLGDHFKPYIGAGVNYTMTYGEDDAGGAVTDFELDNGWGWAAQAGVDYMIDDHWLINVDVKKIWLNLDAKVNGGAIKSDIDVDPWIFGLGIGYRF